MSFRDKVKFTYERDDGACHSWIDHVLCSQSHSSLITDVFARHSDCCLSDHYPLCFSLDFNSSPLPGPSYKPSKSLHIDWQNVSNCDIDKYISLVSQGISTFPSDVYNCISPGCTLHCDTLDLYADHLVSTLLTCALDSFPTRSVSSSRRLVGWNRSLSKHKNATNFWYKIWEEAGCPNAGVLFQIKRNAKRRYKYEVRRLVRRQKYLLQNKLATSFAEKRKNSFWSHVRKLNRSSNTLAPTVDGVCGGKHIANMFASKLKGTLNTHSSSLHLHSSFHSALTESDVCDVTFSEADVLEAISRLKLGKSDAEGVHSEHVTLASSALASPLAMFFTSLLRHGYLPQCLRDCVLVPLPKRNKDTTCSQNYRPIALASSLSKILEHLIFTKYASYLSSSPLQFGFKSGSSTTLCTGMVKNIVSRYINNGSCVLGCFLDASKAFDLVNHDILFHKLSVRGLPLPVIRFLSSWYRSQQMKVRWGHSVSNSFHVSNGVRQGGVLSPVLFAVYLDGLLEELADCGCGCYWRDLFAGAFCYADDIVLLAPCASALRVMLNICCSYASTHGLKFNPEKSQLICFRLRHTHPCSATIKFHDTTLPYSNEVTHLGHVLSYNLDDTPDIVRAVRDINRRVNSILCTFNAADPFVKCFLVKSYCLSLYGCPLWTLSSTPLKIIETALNKLLRKLWNLPRNSHTSIVHSVAKCHSVSNLAFKRFCSLYASALSSSSDLVRIVYLDSSKLLYSFTGFNHIHGCYRDFSSVHELDIVFFIRQIRSIYGLFSPCENLISYLSCL